MHRLFIHLLGRLGPNHPSLCTKSNCRAVVLLSLVLFGQIEITLVPSRTNILAPFAQTLLEIISKPFSVIIAYYVHTHSLHGFDDSTYQHLKHNSYYWFCASCGTPNCSPSLGGLTSFETENSFNVLHHSVSYGKQKLSSTPSKQTRNKSKSISCLSLKCNGLKSLGK